MILAPGLRKLALTAHVTASVGWLGSVAAFLALAATGLTREDAPTVGAAYLAMEMITGYVIVTLRIASLATGVVQSLGTRWGLFRHYRVLMKLVLTLIATVVLLLQIGTIRFLPEAVGTGAISRGELRGLGISMVVHAVRGGGTPPRHHPVRVQAARTHAVRPPQATRGEVGSGR